MGKCLSLHVMCGDGTGSCDLCDKPYPSDEESWFAWRGKLANPVPGCLVNLRQRGFKDNDTAIWWSDDQDWTWAKRGDPKRDPAADIIAYRTPRQGPAK